MIRRPRIFNAALLAMALLLLATGCSSRLRSSDPTAEGAATPAAGAGATPAATPEGPATPAPATPAAAPDADILVDTAAVAGSFDPRLLGSNVPAWLHQPGGREAFVDPVFLERTAASGVSLLRLPGGSWSNYYDWLGCETGNEQRGTDDGCYWPWAARPRDFLTLMERSGLPAVWTVSMQGTAQSAAALVAYFNGSVDDERPIGVDRNGRDWKTVGHWASLRSAAGHPEPRPITHWEIGNEIYGGKQSTAGAECSQWGWEEVWTCDGAAYVSGDDTHDGFLAYAETMRQVDPDILIGAVGVAEQGSWNDWGNKVIAGAGAAMDFYSIHTYPLSEQSTDYARILAAPQQTWGPMVRDVEAAFDRHAGGRRVPVAVTEYNIFAFRDLDSGQLMRRAVNALFVADTLGQFATSGVSVANQWNLANGSFTDGTTDVYAMMVDDSFDPTPQYYVFPLWARFGSQLLPVESRYNAATTLSVYAGRAEDGALTLIAINKTGEPVEAAIRFAGVSGPLRGTADVVQAASLDATVVSYNGVEMPADLTTGAPAEELTAEAGALDRAFPPYSVTLLRLAPGE